MWSSSPKFSLVVSTESATEKHYNPNTEHMCLSHWKWKPNPKFHLPVNLNDHFWTVHSGITICLHHFLSLNTVKVKQHPSQATYFTVKKKHAKEIYLALQRRRCSFHTNLLPLVQTLFQWVYIPSIPMYKLHGSLYPNQTNQINKLLRKCGQS